MEGVDQQGLRTAEVVTVPLTVVVPIFQRRIVSGLNAGSVKG